MRNNSKDTIWAAMLFLAVLVPFLLADCGLCGAQPTVLENIRIGKHEDFQRMVFDLRGARPSQIVSLSDEGIVIEFNELETGVKLEQFSSRLAPLVSGMTSEKKGDVVQVKIMFKDGDVTVNRFFMAGSAPNNGSYRLVLDFKSKGSTTNKTDEKQFSPAPKGSSAPSPLPKGSSGPSPSPKGSSVPSPPSKGSSAASALASVTPSGGATSMSNPEADALYLQADETFLAHKEDLAQYAPLVIKRYLDAIKAGPKASQIPLALYRCGISYLAVEDYKRAEECFKRVIGESPNHSMVGAAWVGLGRVSQEKGASAEAVLAYRTALGYPMEKAEQTDVFYSLGKALWQISSPVEAIETLGRCLAEDPSYYLKKPELLRILGEVHFASGQYEKSAHFLLWYFNLQKSSPDYDLVLARLAETLNKSDRRDQAQKVYQYLKRIYPNSEGEAISEIRKAELLEQQDDQGKAKALEIYRKLAERTLSPSLMRLVVFKLASWEWKHNKNYQESLSLIDILLSQKSETNADKDIRILREKVVLDWATHAYSEKDYAQVIDLYSENKPLFQAQDSVDLDAAVADSYGQVKAYPNALEMYQSLLSRSGKKDNHWIYKTALYFFLMGNLEKASQICDQIQSDSLQSEKTGLLARIYFAQGKYKEAVQHFDKIFGNTKDVDVGKIEEVLQYAEGLAQVGRFTDAVSCALNVSKQLGDDHAEHRVQLALLRSKCNQKLNQPEKSIAALEEALPLVQSEGLKDQLNYQLANLYMEIKNIRMATEKLTQLSKSAQPLWKLAAQQQLNDIQMRNAEPKPVSF